MDLRSDHLEAFHAPGTKPQLAAIGRHSSPSPVDDRNSRSRDRLCPYASPAGLASGRLANLAARKEEGGGVILPKRVGVHKTALTANDS